MIEEIVNFLDPRNDFVSYDKGEATPRSTRTRILIVGLAKSVCRGLSAGAIAGAAVGAVSSPFLNCSYDEAVSINTATGALLGLVDPAQYGVRMLYRVGARIKKHFF